MGLKYGDGSTAGSLVKRKSGSKFNVASRNAILGAVRAGATYAIAARSAGVAPGTLTNWIRRGEYEDSCGSDSEYARFACDFAEADANVLRRVEANVLRASDEDWRAGRFLLAKRCPHIYGDREGAHVIAQRTADWILDQVRTQCDQATYGKVLAAVSGAVEVEGAEVLEANPTKHTEKLVGAASEPPTAPQAASEDAPGIEGERTGYVAAISKHDDPIEVDSEAPVRNFGLREPKGKR